MATIPKKIFYVWGAGEKKKRDVNLCLLSWREKLPDYEIIEINENSVEYFNFQEELKKNQYFREVYKRKIYAAATDYIRLKVLYDNGGIYFDTDVCVLKNLDNFLEEPAFVGIQSSSKDTQQDWVEPAILGAQKGNSFIKEVLDFYNNEIMKTPSYMIPIIFMSYLKKLYGIENFPTKKEQQIIKLKDITLYPEKYFIPYKFTEEFSFDCIEPETHTIHLWCGSWNNNATRYFQKHKHHMPLWLIDFIVTIKRFILNIQFWRKNK